MSFRFPGLRHDWLVLVPVLVLCGMSLACLQVLFPPPEGRLLSSAAVRQFGFLAIGLLAAGATVLVGYHRLGRLAYIFLALCLLALAGLQIDRFYDLSFIPVRNGSRRWLEIGSIQLQPSELVKIVYVLALAWYLRYRRNYRTLPGLVMPFVLTMIPMALILIQPDLGTVLLFLPVLFALLFAAGAKGKHLLTIVLLGVLAMPFFWTQIKDYQRLRLVGMLLQSESLRGWFVEDLGRWDRFCPSGTTPTDWRNELRLWETRAGYQLVHGKTAIGSGQVAGQGWGKGTFVENEWLLPERENDFIFAMVVHQWGLAGGLLVMACYAAIVLIGYDASTKTNDPLGRLVAVGISTLIGVQALTNLCMTMGIGPITGVTLPFLSKGGSSLIASSICIGLLMSTARSRPLLMAGRPFEFDEEAEQYGVLPH